jgi:hypothetical protein
MLTDRDIGEIKMLLYVMAVFLFGILYSLNR